MMMKSSKFFSENELKCPCCGKCEMDESSMTKFDDAREESGIPWPINSGYRCPKHDAEIGGEGNHPQGKAMDILTSGSSSRWKIVSSMVKVGITRIGIGKNFIHGDCCIDKIQNVIWLY